MDTGLNLYLLVMGVVFFCCTNLGQTQELLTPTGEHFDDYRVSGSIYLLHVHEIPASLTDLLLDQIEKYGHVIVKFAGNPISIVRDAEALYHLLHDTVRHTSNVSIAKDLLDVAYISEKNSHLLVVVDEAEAEITEEADMTLAFLRGSTIRVDVIRLPMTQAARYRRQTTNINFYQLLANVSGGSVITTDKNNIGSAVNIITQSLQTSRVNIIRLTYAESAGNFFVFVDDTMTQLIIRVQAEKAQPVVIAMTALGTTSSARPTTIGSVSAGSVVALLEINITQATDYGVWKIVKIDPNIWDVTVQAISPVDFTHKFVEPGPGGFGEYEIKGRPISGATYKIVIDVPEYAKVAIVNAVMLMNRDNVNPIPGFIQQLQNVGGRRGKSMFTANVTIPDQPFMVSIQGRDKSAKTFRRLDPNLITPVTLRLFIPPLTGVTLWANETLDIPFTVQNAGAAEQDVDVRIEDDQRFSLDPIIHSYHIPAGKNETGQFTIKGGPKGGVTTTVTINAKPFVLGSTAFQSGQFEIRRFTVTEHEDKINPTCNITLTTGTCNIRPDPCACVNFMWSADMEIGDEGFGLKKVFLDPASSTFKLTVDSFKQGHNISMGVIKAKLGSDCCLQNASVRVEDLAGNTDECVINITQGWVPPDLQACISTTTTTQSTTTPMSTTTSNSSSTSAVTTMSSQSNGSTLPQTTLSIGASVTSSKAASAYGSSVASTASSAGATQAPAGTPKSGGTQSSSGASQSTGTQASAGTSKPGGTQSASGSSQTGGTQSASGTSQTGGAAGTQSASGSSQSGVTQAPSGTPKSGTTQAATATNNEESKSSDSNNGLTAVSIGAGMGIGAVIGVTALGAMACLFKKAMTKGTNSVAPQENGGRRADEERRERERIQRNLAWT